MGRLPNLYRVINNQFLTIDNKPKTYPNEYFKVKSKDIAPLYYNKFQ